MFARYYLNLDIAFAGVEAAMLADPEAWVPGLLLAAEDRGNHLLAEVGVGIERARIDKEVEIGFGSPYRVPGKTLLPMAWRATGPTRMFPHLDADIEIASLGAARTQLSISARYRPPMGVVGRVLDRAVLHRVAEATIKDFLDRVADRVRATSQLTTTA